VEVGDPLARSLLALDDDLLLISGEFALLLQDGLSAETVLLIDLSSLQPGEGSSGVQVMQGLVITQRVALLDMMSGNIALLGTDGALNFVAVDDSADVGVGNLSAGQNVALLLDSTEPAGSEDIVEFLEGIGSPNDEPTNVSSWGQLKEIQSADVEGLHTGDVSDGTEQRDVVTLVDNKGSTSTAITSVTELAQTSSDSDSVDDLSNVGIGTNVLEELNGLLCALDTLDLVVNDERELGDLIHTMTAGLHQGQNSGGSESRSGGVPLLPDVDLAVPSPPDLDRSEHATLPAHVSKGSLTTTMGSTTTNTRNTGDGSTSSPTLSGVLHTSTGVNGVTLPAILAHVLVHLVDNIQTDAGSENAGQHDVLLGLFKSLGILLLEWLPDADVLTVDHFLVDINLYGQGYSTF
jgi:hypothetical protein